MINSSELYKDGDKYRLRQQKFLKYLEPVLCTFKVFDNISQSKHIFSLMKFVKLLIATFGGYFGYKWANKPKYRSCFEPMSLSRDYWSIVI